MEVKSTAEKTKTNKTEILDILTLEGSAKESSDKQGTSTNTTSSTEKNKDLEKEDKTQMEKPTIVLGTNWSRHN
jgi:hypothetical protein